MTVDSWGVLLDDSTSSSPLPSPSEQPSRLNFERLDLLFSTARHLMHGARLVEAELILREVVKRAPNDLRGYIHLASVREQIGDVEESLALLDTALTLSPKNPSVIGNLIFSHDRRPDTTLEESYALRRRFNDLIKQPVRPHLNDRAPDRKLKVGYVSGDFRHHSAALIFAAVLLRHDKDAVAVYAYSMATSEDWLTEMLRNAVGTWRDISIWDDDQLDQQIREDQIDILVDLSGHSAGNRLRVFARKPAPIQVTAWGYITGTGLDAMDYLFADEDTVLPCEEQWYSETIVRLPRIVSFLPPDPELVGQVGLPPCLTNGHLTFGVFNRLGKLKRGTIDLWARILLELPDARLIVKSPGLDDEPSRLWLQHIFFEAGADLGRIQFRGTTSHSDHLKAYHEVDVCLDPWPDGGGVSTLEAMWMGVPSVTLPHRQIASRLTTSFNRELGLTYLIAASADEYVERAVSLNSQRAEMTWVRALLRDMMSCSIICDQGTYTRYVEREYREMWHRWCAGQTAGVRPTGVTLVAS